jgi:hypothetical protein
MKVNFEISIWSVVTIAIMAAPFVLAWVMSMKARKKRDAELYLELREQHPDMSPSDRVKLWDEKRRKGG